MTGAATAARREHRVQVLQLASAKLCELAALIAFGLFMPLTPLLWALICGSAEDLRHYPGSLRRSLQMLRTLAVTGGVARNLLRGWSTAELVRIEGSCTHCGRCCLHRRCVFLSFDSEERSHCRIYGNWVWRRTSCARYPIDGADIAVYDCPSFRVVPIVVSESLGGAASRCRHPHV